MYRHITASNDENIRIGAHIKKWRMLKGIKQRHLACMVHLSDSSISNMEKQITIPTLHQVQEIARSLEISLDMILNDPEIYLNQRVGAGKMQETD